MSWKAFYYYILLLPLSSLSLLLLLLELVLMKVKKAPEWYGIMLTGDCGCSWYPWGFDSCKFVEVWRYFVEIIRGRTCRTVFMWAPADGGGYPFAGMIYRQTLPQVPFITLHT